MKVHLHLGRLVGTAARLPWATLRACGRGARRVLRSARFWIAFLFTVVVLLVAYYALMDKYTPFTTDAYVQAYVIQVAPQVEGEVVRVYVGENQPVARGELLFEIDRRPFEHKVRELGGNLARMTQQVAQLDSELAAARAEEDRIAAERALALAIYQQEKTIFSKSSTTERKYLEAEQKHKAAVAAVDRARAQVRQKEQALAAKVGAEHALVVEARAQLETARLKLGWTRVVAPANGYVTNVQLRAGSYATAGRPVLTVVDADQWWVVANFRENNLEYLAPGRPAGVAFRGYPGRIFPATVQSVGWGVGQGQGVPSGELPAVKAPQEWLHPAQRFQVRVALDHPADVPLRVGATASVVVYATDDSPLNPVARFWQEVETRLNYLR
jgi:multidrug resistance efflux pump